MIRPIVFLLLFTVASFHAQESANNTSQGAQGETPAEQGQVETKEVNQVTVLTLSGTINPATSMYLQKGIAMARDLVVIKLNTPGGLLQATRDIVQCFLDSEIPVVVYVTPRGGQAASAGMFITMAGHVAAMSPATNIGAASPVQLTQGEQKEDNENTKTLARKAMHDTAAFARSIAFERGRNAEWAEQAVREAVSLTAEEAVHNNVVNFIANDFNHLLEQLNGMIIKTKSIEFRLAIHSPEIKTMDMGLKERLLDLISNPNIAYILMIIGFYGIYFELSNPGALFPGIVGGICLILGFFAMQTLPMNYAGIALLILGLVLFILETQIPSGGLLSVGAIISFSLGSFMLFDPEASFPILSVSLGVILPVVILTSLFFMFAVGVTVKAAKKPTQTGPNGLEGQTAKVFGEINPVGQVEIHGEIWRAKSNSSPIPEGVDVLISQVKGLTLWVDPINKD